MSLATLFPISLYLMVAIASAILAYAEGTALPTVLTLPLAFLAYRYSERRSILVLSGWFANLLGLVALAFAALEFVSDNPEGRLLSGAHLLVYLSWLVMFLQKNRHHYWWTIALSLLQVAVSAVLTQEPAFGMLLIMFAFITIWTISLFSVFLAYQDEIDSDLDPENAASGLSQRLSAHHVQSSKGTVLFGMPSRSIGGIEFDPRARWVGLRFGARAMGITAICLTVGMTFFLCIPRLWSDINPFNDEALAGRNVSGFSENVRLGQMGEILASNQPALSVKIYDDPVGKQVTMERFLKASEYDEPYFRGAVMDRYENGSWKTTRDAIPYLLNNAPSRNAFRQDYELEPLGTLHLFCIHPVQSVHITSPKDAAIILPNTSILLRRKNQNKSEKMLYSVYTDKFSQEITFRLEAQVRGPQRAAFEGLFQQVPKRGMERIRKKAIDVSGFAADSTLSTEIAASRLLNHLQASGEYTYSLKSNVLDNTIDPVEDFLFNRKEGHCEYYASSLALMLRCVGIPSRMVTGYKGGAENSETGAWEVQQRHAHAWVEGYFNGRWNTLDPTPAAPREEGVVAAAKLSFSWTAIMDSVTGAWRRYVVGMNFNDQKRKFAELTQGGLKQTTLAFVAEVKQVALNLWDFITTPERWFSPQGGLIAFTIMACMTGLFFMVRKIIRMLRNWLSRKIEKNRRRRQIEFYERFLQFCERHKQHKEPSQTPREFARQVTEVWNARLREQRLAEIPENLIERFYSIRYGTESLDHPEERALIETVTRLERAFKPSDQAQPALSPAT